MVMVMAIEREKVKKADAGDLRPRPGHLAQAVEDLEALNHRVGSLKERLQQLYGESEESPASPDVGGTVPRIGSLIEDLSLNLQAVEGLVNRL